VEGPSPSGAESQILGFEAETENARRAAQALLATPVVVLDGGTATTGSSCTIEYDAQNNVHLAYREDDHPSLYYGKWNGSSWAIELVDGMGFNTGGLVGERFSMAIDSAGRPHLAYFVDGKGVFYATRTAQGTWARERVDSALRPAYDTDLSLALDPANEQRPTVVYQQYLNLYGANVIRIVWSARTGANTWTQTLLNLSNNGGNQYLSGDLLISGTGVGYIPLNSGVAELASLVATPGVPRALPGARGGWYNATWGQTATKALYRTKDSEDELEIATPFSASLVSQSRVEISGAEVGDIAYRGKPYLLHLHGRKLELVTTDANNYWTYTELGSSSGAQPGLAVSASGVVSICYQADSRIMFQ
jgi:hypothetical protein